MCIRDSYNTADKAYFINKYRNAKQQVTKTSLHIAFNKTCRKHNIIPTHAQVTIKQNTHTALQTKRKLEQINLNNIINYLHHKKTHSTDRHITVSYTHLDVYKRQEQCNRYMYVSAGTV